MTDQPHILIVTETTADGVTEQDYEIECPGVTKACRMWLTCQTCQSLDYDLDDDGKTVAPVVHGVEHQSIEDMWMTPTDNCFVQVNDYLAEAAEPLNLKPGRYPVGFDFGDGCDLELTVLEIASA